MNIVYLKNEDELNAAMEVSGGFYIDKHSISTLTENILNQIHETFVDETHLKVIGYKKNKCKDNMSLKVTTLNGVICIALTVTDSILFTSGRETFDLYITPVCVYLKQFGNKNRLPKTTAALRQYLRSIINNYDEVIKINYDTVRANRKSTVDEEIDEEIKNEEIK